MRVLHILVALLAIAPLTKAEPQAAAPASSDWLKSSPYGADADVVGELKGIFGEPEYVVRYALLEWIAHTKIEKDFFQRAFDAMIEEDGRDFSDSAVEVLLRVWAERDPVAAWKRCESLFPIVIPGAVLGFDAWREKIVVVDIEAVRASKFWISDEGVLLSYLYGLERSSESPQKIADLRDRFSKKYKETFGHPPPGHPRQDLEPVADWRPIAQEILEAKTKDPKELVKQIPTMKVEEAREIAFLRCLESDRSQAIALAELTTSDPHHLPLRFFAEWAKHDADGVYAWINNQTKEIAATAGGAALSEFDEEKRSELLNRFRAQEDDLQAYRSWASIDYERALPAIWHASGSYAYSESAYQANRALGYTSNPHLRKFREFLKGYAVPLNADELGWIMENWVDSDVADASKYGVRWLLDTRIYPREELLQCWSGKRGGAHDDGGAADRTFCALRVWAVVRPNEMRAWIQQQVDPEIRNALIWLLEHPYGHDT